MTVSVSDVDRLRTLLREQRGVIEELSELAADQSRLIAGAETDALLGLLARRQALVDRFTRLQAACTEAMDRSAEAIAAAGSATRSAIREEIDAIFERLEQVMAVDAEDQQRLASRRDEVRAEVSEAGLGRRAQHAYGSRPEDGARFTDSRC